MVVVVGVNGLRYVVLRHEGIPDPHFDLMFELEAGSPLATWRSDSWPPPPGRSIRRIGDHRREYLGYEGPVSNDRGSVRRIEAGTYERLPDFPTSMFALRLHGTRERVLYLQGVGDGWYSPWLREAAD